MPQIQLQRVGHVTGLRKAGRENVGQAGELRPTITTAPFPVQAGDAALLCSDGVWTYVWEPEMEADLAAAASPADWLDHLEQRVLARAEGPYDNYTAVAVWFQGV